MLNWFAGGEVGEYPIPSLCIYTDHLPSERLNDLINGRTLEFEDHKVFVQDVVPLEADWNYNLNYDLLHPLHKSGMSVLYGDGKYEFISSEPSTGAERIFTPVNDDDFIKKMDLFNGRDLVEKIFMLRVVVEFEHDTLDEPETSSYETNLLFFFHEQVAFFKKFILDAGLRVTYLVTIHRKHRPFLTGRVFEHLIGYMGVKYLITRFEKTRPQTNEIFLTDPEIVPLIKHARNRRYLLEDLVSYGLYETIFKVKYIS